jgi:hypothetical protein
MRLKHNKKRNTAFLYEALIKELTKTIIHKEESKKEKIVLMIRESFNPKTLLGQELLLYKNLNETQGLDMYTAERLIAETRRAYFDLDKKNVFNAQTYLIAEINKTLSKNVFANFVPSYKNLATIAQIFSTDIPVKDRVLLERKLMSSLTVRAGNVKNVSEKNLPHIDGLVYKRVVENFNKKYDGNLLSEQKNLLNHYLMAFNDNGVSLKVFLSEEIGRMKTGLAEVLNSETGSMDEGMKEKAQLVLEKLSDFRNKKIDAKVIHDVLKIQNLLSEFEL